MGIGYFNILHRPSQARTAYDKAVRLAPRDARLLFERDQLAKKLGESPAKRLRIFEKQIALASSRDDLSVELCALYNQTGQPQKAKSILMTRSFQPWEGGEGQTLGQHVRTALLLGRQAMNQGDLTSAIAHFEHALTSPLNLGESKHLLANQSDIWFWLGEAKAQAGDRAGAKAAWKSASSFKGDFQEMSVKAFSEMSYFSALAWERLGQKSKATRLLQELLAHAKTLEKQPAKIDYFATSLPTMLLFEDDIQARQITTARFMQAQALLGLGQKAKAAKLLQDVLLRDPSHPLASDLQRQLR